MNRALLLLLLSALPAFAQKNQYEAKVVENDWGNEGNGGIELTGAFLDQSLQVDCTRCVHGRLHVMDFGGGPFLIDDEGYVFPFTGANHGVLPWTSAKTPGDDLGIRDFANGVH